MLKVKRIIPKKNPIDFNVVREISLSIENDYPTYQKEQWLTKNYERKWNKGKFNFSKAQGGVKNLIVTPFARKYQNEWGVKVGAKERDAIAKSRFRSIFRDVKSNSKNTILINQAMKGGK